MVEKEFRRVGQTRQKSPTGWRKLLCKPKSHRCAEIPPADGRQNRRQYPRISTRPERPTLA